MKKIDLSTHEPTLVRNRDSWRLAYITAELGTHVLVRNAQGPNMWPKQYIEPIEACNLDKALMNLHLTHPDLYGEFLATMLGDSST